MYRDHATEFAVGLHRRPSCRHEAKLSGGPRKPEIEKGIHGN